MGTATLEDAAERRPGQGVVLEGLRGVYRESLICQHDALEAVRLDLQDGRPYAVASARRLAHGLYGLGYALGFPDVSAAALQVEQADEAALPSCIDALLDPVAREIERGAEDQVLLLIADPDPNHAALLEVALAAPSREVRSVGTVAEAEAVLDECPVSLLLLALGLPDADGRDLLVRLRASSRTALMPVFVLTHLRSPQVKLECLALGADAFYEKPFDIAVLSATISARLQRRASYDSKDPLTGLPDRIALADAFHRVCAFYGFDRHRHCLALLDFDHLGAVNEVHGHDVGDVVLRRGAALIGQSLRDADILGRWEGQQFVVLFPDTSPSEAQSVLEGALQGVRHEPFSGPRGEAFRVSFSAGLTEVAPPADTLEAAVVQARWHMQAAKHNGRARIETSAEEVESAAAAVLLVEDDPLIARILESRLVQEGFQVIHEDDGARAYRRIQEDEVDLVLLDVKLPGLDGFELLERLRRIPAYAHVPVVMLTAMASEQEVMRGFELGADDYVLKPFSLVELVARIRRLLRRCSSAAQLLHSAA